MRYRNPVYRRMERRDKKNRDKKRLTIGLIVMVSLVIIMIISK